MTTFEHGKSPAWACATYTVDNHGFIRTITVNGADDQVLASAIESPRLADRLCRALSLAKLAEDWAAADSRFRHTVGLLNDMFVENVASQSDARKSDAARADLLKACAE